MVVTMNCEGPRNPHKIRSVVMTKRNFVWSRAFKGSVRCVTGPLLFVIISQVVMRFWSNSRSSDFVLGAPLWDGSDATSDKSRNIMHYTLCRYSRSFFFPFKSPWSVGPRALLQVNRDGLGVWGPFNLLAFLTLSYKFINNEFLCPFILLVHLVLSMLVEGRFHLRGDCGYSPQSTMTAFFSSKLVICESLWLWVMVGSIL